MKILSLWSGPRNVSTALMYSFAQRPDTKVVDEPLYAHYLSKIKANHPGEQEVIDRMENDGEKVMQAIYHHNADENLLFLKNMAHHWVSLDNNLLNGMYHLFLIRDPKEMLPSLINQLEEPVLRDTGLKKQKEMYDLLRERGEPVQIIDARLLLSNPEKMLRLVCDAFEIPFFKSMLSWNKGPRPEDGIWARYWYHNVHQSTGFAPYKAKEAPFPTSLVPLLTICEPYYEYLFERALKI